MALVTLYVSINTILNNRLDADLHEDIAEFNELFAEEGMEEVIQEMKREINSSDESEIFLRVVDEKGTSVFSSDLSEWEGVDSELTRASPAELAQSGSVLQTVAVADQEYAARAISGLLGQHHILQIGETTEKKEEIMAILLWVFGGLLIVGVPVASVSGWLIARKAIRGIEEVSRAAKAIEGGDLSRRVSVESHEDEIQTLANSFNAMGNRIKSLIDEMRDMTDNIAHDLRSPLARIRAMSESSLASEDGQSTHHQVASDTLKECDRLMHLINTTLDMAEFEAGVTSRTHEPINLTQLIGDLVELFEPSAEAKHITLQLLLEDGCHIVGDKHNIQRMVANLLDNALKYTSEGGEVTMELKKSSQGYQLTIADTGVGIPFADQPRIFDRFYRCDQSRSLEGCGLGLSFARSVARAHGGDIILKSEPTKGSVFTTTFPSSSLR